MEDPAITRVDVYPDYARGFVFSWDVNPALDEPGPWEYLVQAGESESGPWSDISPVMSEVSMWRWSGPLRVGKAQILFFRVLMRTGSGVKASSPVSPYGDLGRRDFLIGRDVMRREVLHMSRMAGVRVQLYRKVPWGPRCGCVDPVTHQMRDSHCRKCLGTGRVPPYLGPFEAWALFSEDGRHSVEHAQGGLGTVEPKEFQARVIASVPMAKRDVVKDVASGKMYYVDSSAVSAEIRRIPLVRTLGLLEVAVTDPVYKVMGAVR